MSRRAAPRARALPAVFALAFACNARPIPEPAPKDMPQTTGPNTPVPEAMPDRSCTEARDVLGDLAWLPRDLRLAAILDLGDPGVDAAAAELGRAAPTLAGLPIVAGLGLGQLDLQLRIVRRQLDAAALAPRELLLLHRPDGAVVWVLRVRCDLALLQSTLTRAWSVRSRASAAGPIAEPAAGAAFPYDVLFLADDRLALVPAGAGGQLRRWLEGQDRPPELAPSRTAETPGESLAAMDPAPIRVVLAGRALLAGDAPAAPRTLQAWPDRVVAGAPPAP